MKPKTTARIHLLPAKDAPIVAVIRRKPSKCFHVMKWHTDTDEIEYGSWFRGGLYPKRSDISHDGQWMVYLALDADGTTWNRLCQLPSLTAFCESPNMGTYNSGGYWPDSRNLFLNCWFLTQPPGGLPFSVTTYTPEYGGDLGVLFPRLERDGWRRAGPLGPMQRLASAKQHTVVCENDPGWYSRPTSHHPTLRAFYRGHLTHGATFEFALDDHPGLLGPEVEWATWDSLGQLIFAKSGIVAKFSLEALATGRPSCEISLEHLLRPA